MHPYRIHYCDGPISSRARQLNRDIAEVPRASDKLIKLGPCSGKGRINTFSMGQKYLCGVVVGHRIGEKRRCIGGRIEANVSDGIKLARQRRMCDPWKPGFRQYGDTECRNGLLTKDFSRVF